MTMWGVKSRRAAVAVVLTAAVAAAAQAEPIVGVYDSTDLSGNVRTGRWTEGFAGGLPNQPGNGAHAQSWDGATLGTQWELTGPTILTTTVTAGNPALPSGIVIYHRVFSVVGAQLILDQSGPWWNAGDPGTQYLVDLTSYEQDLTVTYENFLIKEASSIETFNGTFQGYPGYEVRFGHTVGAYEGMGGLPAGYPAFEPGGTLTGAWGLAEGVRFTIVPEPGTIGLLGLGAVGLVLRRKRHT